MNHSAPLTALPGLKRDESPYVHALFFQPNNLQNEQTLYDALSVMQRALADVTHSQVPIAPLVGTSQRRAILPFHPNGPQTPQGYITIDMDYFRDNSAFSPNYSPIGIRLNQQGLTQEKSDAALHNVLGALMKSGFIDRQQALSAADTIHHGNRTPGEIMPSSTVSGTLSQGAAQAPQQQR